MLKNLLTPIKFQYAVGHFGRDSEIRILDVGCGNNSPSLTKRYFPSAKYDGLDIQRYNLSDADARMIDNFYLVDPDDDFSSLPKDAFDFIIVNHVIEHIPNPLPRIESLCQCLATDGVLYIAFPAEATLGFPSAKGTLQFCDDPTHVYLPSVREVANVMIKNGVSVSFGGRVRDLYRFLIGIPFFVLQNVGRLFGRKMTTHGLWTIYGFEAAVIGIKRQKSLS